jgi:hypothetical protein
MDKKITTITGTVSEEAHSIESLLLSRVLKDNGFTWRRRNDPDSPIRADIISFEPTATVFEPRGDKAYVDRFYLEQIKGDTNALKVPIFFQ